MPESESQSGNRNDASKDANEAKAKEEAKVIAEKNLQRMEAMLKHSALGIHVLFDNEAIAKALKSTKDDKDFFDFNKMKLVQDCMTALIAKKTYFEKMAYLQDLDSESYHMLIRTYFHIVENSVRTNSSATH